MKSTTTIRKQVKRKTDSSLVKTLIAARKNVAWRGLAARLSGPRRNYPKINLKDLDSQVKEGDTIVVPGKVLGVGTVSKKIRISAVGFSASARANLKKSQSEIVTILDEIQKNPKAQGVKILP